MFGILKHANTSIRRVHKESRVVLQHPVRLEPRAVGHLASPPHDVFLKGRCAVLEFVLMFVSIFHIKERMNE